MQLLPILSILALSSIALAQLFTPFTASVTFDPTFDDADGSTATVSCSGTLAASGKPTFGSLLQFPLIGGAPNITSFDSPNCGTCWQLSFAETGQVIPIFAIDSAASFNIALEAMNDLTDGQAEQLGRVTVSAQQVPVTFCNPVSRP